MGLAAILLASEAPEHPEDGIAALWNWRDDSTLIEYHLDQLAAAGVRDIEVVLGYEADRVIAFLSRDGIEGIIDASWRAGEASSLRVGAAAVPRGTHIAIIMRIQEPRPAWILERLIDAHLDASVAITRPLYQGRAGAPIIVDERVLMELRNLPDGDGALDGLVRAHDGNIHDVECDDPVVVSHVNAPGDLQRL